MSATDGREAGREALKRVLWDANVYRAGSIEKRLKAMDDRKTARDYVAALERDLANARAQAIADRSFQTDNVRLERERDALKGEVAALRMTGPVTETGRIAELERFNEVLRTRLARAERVVEAAKEFKVAVEHYRDPDIGFEEEVIAQEAHTLNALLASVREHEGGEREGE